MATSVIQQKISEPEYVTQTVIGYASIARSGTVQQHIISGINSITASLSGSTLSSATFNVAKAGYTLVGMSYVTSTAYEATTTDYKYLAGFRGDSRSTDSEYPARITVSGNNLVLTPCSASGSASDYERSTTTITIGTGTQTTVVYLGKVICKYIKD